LAGGQAKGVRAARQKDGGVGMSEGRSNMIKKGGKGVDQAKGGVTKDGGGPNWGDTQQKGEV